MTDVLLASSYFIKDDPKQLSKMEPYPPLATLFAAGYLRSSGRSVALFDATLSPGIEEFEHALTIHQPRYVALYEDSFHFLLKMCLLHVREASHQMARIARDAGAKVIAAGPDATDHADLYLENGVDFVIRGEGEHSLKQLIDALDEGGSPRSIDGITYREGNRTRTNRPRPAERNPDVFGMPAWGLVNFEPYRDAWIAAHGRFSLNMVSTRGCPYHCNWCAKPIWGQHYAARSPQSVAAELRALVDLANPDHIWFADDIFGLRPGWVADFAVELEKRQVRVPFTIQSRVDRMSEEAVAGLATAGCEAVWMGTESGSQSVLDAMDKGVRVGDIPIVRERLRTWGIKANYFLQFGYPGETVEDIRSTIDLVRMTLPDSIGISVSYPLPGTRFYDRVRKHVGEKSNWDDSGDLDMMFPGPYTTDFYRSLHRLVHADHALRVDCKADSLEIGSVGAELEDLLCRAPEFRNERSLDSRVFGNDGAGRGTDVKERGNDGIAVIANSSLPRALEPTVVAG